MSNPDQAGTAPLPTLKDVADMAGVSTATVSRCLNSPEQVTERTRLRVMAVVKELGYAPNFGARALAAKRTNTFGAIVPTMENAIFARGLQAFQEELGEHGITMLVASSSYSPVLEEEQIRALIARGADALLLIGHARTAESYALLKQRNIPHVVVWAYDEREPRISVGFDNLQAMATLAREVLKLGHKRLALITATMHDNDRARARRDGIQQEMKNAGLDPDSLGIIEMPYTISDGAQAFREFMAREAPPTAVMCANDVLAAGALLAAEQMGIDVPGQVSITGFDDIEIAEIVRPSLTTLHVPHRQMGRIAAQLLVDMRNDKDVRSRPLETRIAWRNSLGPAPRS